MVFGALLGGLVNRAGERSYEEMKRQRDVEDFQRQHRINFNVDFLNKHYDDLTPERQVGLHQQIAKDIGMNPKDMEAYVGGLRGAHQILQSLPAPVNFGQAPAIQPAALGSRASLEQLPMPSETVPSPFVTHQPSVPLGPGPAEAIQSIRPISPVMPSPLPSSIYAQQPAQSISGPSMTPGEVKEQRKFEMEDRIAVQKYQRSVAQIMNSTLSPEDKALAIKALHIPPGILAAQERQAATGSNVGLNIMQLTSPDGKQILEVQPTRTGHYVESGTGRIISPAEVAGWHKRIVAQPYIYPTANNQLAVLSKEELMRQGVSGLIPGAPPMAENRPVATDPTGAVIGDYGARTGASTFRTIQEAQGQAAPPNAPQGPPPKFYKGAMSEGTQTQLDTHETLKSDIEELVNLMGLSHVQDRIGPIMGRGTSFFRGWVDQGSTPEQTYDINEMFRITDNLKDLLVRARSGKAILGDEDRRLSGLVPNPRGPINKFKSDLRGFVRELNAVRARRDLPPLDVDVEALGPEGEPPIPTISQPQGGAQLPENQVIEINGVKYKKVPGGLQRLR